MADTGNNIDTQVEEKKSKGKEGRVEDQAAQAEHFQVRYEIITIIKF